MIPIQCRVETWANMYSVKSAFVIGRCVYKNFLAEVKDKHVPVI
jgi:hypothetical protein